MTLGRVANQVGDDAALTIAKRDMRLGQGVIRNGRQKAGNGGHDHPALPWRSRPR